MEDFNVYNVNLDKKEALEAIKNKFIEIGNVEKNYFVRGSCRRYIRREMCFF